jgi:hypothetical protein
VSSSGVIPALPMAAALAVLSARFLPLRFEYRGNDLGIVSLATLERYPQQQESFWLLASALVATLATWLMSRRLACRGLPVGRLAAIEACAAVCLGAVLWLPLWLGAPAAGIAAAAAFTLAGRSSDAPPAPGGQPDRPEAPPPRRPLWYGWALYAAALLLALALTPLFWVNLWSVARGLPDAARVVDGFPFMGETGQHLAWANALRRGGFHGKDFFCLYAPLYDLGVVALWRVVGRSIAAWDLYFSMTRVLALAGMLLLTGLLVRRRVLLLAIPFLLPWINLRTGFALYGLCFLYAWLRGGGLAWVAAAGLTAGLSVLFSQEFGLAFALVAAAAFLLRWEWRPPLAFGGAMALVVAPLLAWYAANDALLPMLGEVVAYPAYIVAGYAKLPFPALVAKLPIRFTDWHTHGLLLHQLGYGVPAVCLGALLLCLPISSIDPRAPLGSARRVVTSLRVDPWRTALLLLSVYGLLSFRSALGRSDLKHMIDALPAAAILLVVAFDRVAASWRPGGAPGAVTLWRAALLVLLLVQVGFTAAPSPVRDLQRTAITFQKLWEGVRFPAGDRNIMRVTRWIQLHTEAEDPVLFLPNNGAYYYLTDRLNPIRFVMGHQIVTQAHRDEVLAALRSRPPRYVVWDDAALRVDGLSDQQVFGEPLLGWLEANYEEEERIGATSIRRRRGSP